MFFSFYGYAQLRYSDGETVAKRFSSATSFIVNAVTTPLSARYNSDLDTESQFTRQYDNSFFLSYMI